MAHIGFAFIQFQPNGYLFTAMRIHITAGRFEQFTGQIFNELEMLAFDQPRQSVGERSIINESGPIVTTAVGEAREIEPHRDRDGLFVLALMVEQADRSVQRQAFNDKATAVMGHGLSFAKIRGLVYSKTMDEKRFTCLNGSFLLAHRAAVSVEDRGFRFGDGVFETIRVVRCTPIYWDAHMQRLAIGLRALSIELSIAELEANARKLLHKNSGKEGFLRIAVSRGTGSKGYAPHPPGMPASWVIEWMPVEHTDPKPAALYLSSIARIPPACLPTGSKLAQGLNSTLAIMEAKKHGADEALQLAIDGTIAEASSANIFWLKDKTLYTPSLETGCLGGITRENLLRLSPLPTKIVRDGLSALNSAEAVFLTNCRAGVWPVTSLAPVALSFNAKHPMLRQLQGLLAQDKQRHVFRERARWSAK